MTKFTNKLFAIVLTIVMLASTFVVPAFADEEAVAVSGSDAQYAVDLLNVLGITDLAYNTDLNASVSRAEFALLLTSFVNAEPIKNIAGVSFNDVLAGSYEEDYIKTVVSMGYMPVVEEGYFYPAWAITAKDAAHAFLLALGYGGVANTEQTITSFANRLDLYDGVDVNNFTRAQLYIMMYNALMAKVMDQAGFKDGELVYEQLSDINGLYYFHDVIKTEGTITGAGGVVLGSGNRADLANGYILVDDYKFVCPNHDMSNIIGRNAYVYWRDIRGSEIENAIHVEVIDEDTLTLSASEIVNYSSLAYEYEEGDKIKTYKVNKPYVIYNGEEYTGSYTKDIMMPENGDVTIVKADGGRDVVIVRSFQDVLVNFVMNDAESQVILGKNGERFDVGTFAENVEYYDADGFPMALSDIKQNTVISVAESNSGEKHIIYISTEVVSGEITLKDDEYWTIGEVAYKPSPALFDAIENETVKAPDFGKQYTFYLNCNGEIAFVDEGTSALAEGVFYGVVTGISTGSGFQDNVSIKVFSKAMGGFEIYPIAEKLELNGKRVERIKVIDALKKKTRDALGGTEFVAQPVKVGLNSENEVNYLMQSATNNDDGLGFFYFMGSTDPAKTGTYYQYRNVLSYSKSGGRDFAAAPKDDGYLQAGVITATETIQVPFYAPTSDEGYMGKVDIDSEKAFISATRPSGTIPFVVYKEDDEDLFASFIIRAVEAGEKEHCESTVNVHCILSITEKIVDDELVTCIKTNKMTYYLDNPKINLNALKIWDTLEKPDAVVPWIDPATGVQGVHKVVPGDIVNIVADATGFIKAMEIVYDSENNRMMGKGTGTGASYGYINSDTIWYSRNTQYNITLLHVLKIEDGYMSATNAKDPAEFIDDPSVARHYLGVVPPIICVETSGKKLTSRNAVNSDLIGYYDSPDDHATVLLMHRYAQQQGTSFVIKK